MDYFDAAARHIDAYTNSFEDGEMSELTYEEMGEDYHNMLEGVVLALVKFINTTPGAADGLGIEHVSSLNL